MQFINVTKLAKHELDNFAKMELQVLSNSTKFDMQLIRKRRVLSEILFMVIQAKLPL